MSIYYCASRLFSLLFRQGKVLFQGRKRLGNVAVSQQCGGLAAAAKQAIVDTVKSFMKTGEASMKP
jgi:hypothetical protein